MKQRGFTLIELLVVIAIIGILSSVVLASLNQARQKSRDARRIADIKQIQTALELYYDATNSTYPALLSALATTYIPVVPTDPSSSAVGYTYAALGSGATCSSYHLGMSLENGSNSALQNDADAAVGTICTGSGADFSGISAAAGGAVCSATAGTARTGPSTGTETCYDVRP